MIWKAFLKTKLKKERFWHFDSTGSVMKKIENEKMLFIRYEDLCLYPEVTMLKIYNYLDIPFFKHDFENIEQVTKEDDEIYGVFGDHTIRKSLELTPSTANKILGTDVTEWIYSNYRWFYDTFKYEKNI